MATSTVQCSGNIEEIAEALTMGVLESAISCELECRVDRSCGQAKAILLVFEKYYIRSSNRASLTVMLTEMGDLVNVDAVGSGGGQGPIIKFSWGAEEDFVDVVRRVLIEKGYA